MEVDVGNHERSLKLLLSDLTTGGDPGEGNSGRGSGLAGRGRVKVHQRELISETLVL
jgi:hypothetical protein